MENKIKNHKKNEHKSVFDAEFIEKYGNKNTEPFGIYQWIVDTDNEPAKNADFFGADRNISVTNI